MNMRTIPIVTLILTLVSAQNALSYQRQDFQFPLMKQDTSKGVAVINTERGRYKPGETVKFSMAILNPKGKMVCDADARVVIKNLDSDREHVLSTRDGTIRVNPECSQKTFHSTPDYEGSWEVPAVGVYEARLTAQTSFGEYNAVNIFKVKDHIPFRVKRLTATRIYPKHQYPVTLRIKANQDFKGVVIEKVPKEFSLDVNGSSVKINEDNEWKTITWQVHFKKGEKHELTYSYKAPNRSPEYYELGRMTLWDGEKEVFRSFKRWQIAGDVEFEHYIARAVAEQTTAAGTWNIVTGTAETGTAASANGWIAGSNFTVGEQYLILCWGYYNNSSANSISGMRITHGGAAFAESESTLEVDESAAAYKMPYFWFTVWTAANEDLEVEYNRSGNTSRVEDVTLVVMNAEDLITNGDLQYNIDTAGGTISTTLATKASVTWTPDNNGDTWLVMAYSRGDINAVTGDTYEQRLVLGGTNMTTAIIDGEDTTNTPVLPSAYARTFTNASTTIALQIRRGNGAHAWLAAGIFALRLNVFETFVIDATAGTVNMDAGNNNYNTLATITRAQGRTGSTIVAGGFIADDNGARVTARIQQDNTTDLTAENGGSAWATTDQTPFIAADIASYEARVAATWDLDGRETANTTNPDAEDPWLAMFTMEQPFTRRMAIVDN